MSGESRQISEDGVTPPAIQFDKIAFLYDDLMAGVPYRQWVDYLWKLLRRHGCSPARALDLCCGTGRVSLMLAQAGCEVAGVDISPEMIGIAQQRAEDAGQSIDFRVQDASNLRVGKKFDLVVSFFDSLNYILDATALQQAFYRVAEHMTPGGLFIFDMNTEFALKAGLFTQNNLAFPHATVHYNWRSSYDHIRRLCRVQMDFTYHGDGSPRKLEVVHHQRAYDMSEIERMLRTAGLEVRATYHAYTFRRVTGRTDRVFFVAEKPAGLDA